jgi:hypothetical protein
MILQVVNRIYYRLELYHDLTSCWLDALALATMRFCIEQTLQISTLSPTGLKQLLMDLRMFECIFQRRTYRDDKDRFISRLSIECIGRFRSQRCH